MSNVVQLYKHPSLSTMLSIPLRNGEYTVPQTLVTELQNAYPGIDVLSEIRKMRAWCLTNPAKRKTRRGINRFINNWLNRNSLNETRQTSRPRTERLLQDTFQDYYTAPSDDPEDYLF